jgi:cytochrome P450
MVAQLRPRIEEIADGLLDRVQDASRIELIADLAYPLPVTVICVLLGVPPADHVRFHGWSDAIARSLDLTDASAVYDRAADAAVALTDYLGGLLEERRARPREDLLSALVAVEEQGDRLTRDELFATCALLLIAGHETTVNLIGNGTLALLRHPDQWRRVREEPDLIPTAVEELLRYDSPVQLTARVALEDVPYRDHLFRRGSQVTVLLGSANRDPDQFAAPETLDVGRRDNRHLSFGGGIHYCLGAPLARLEGEVVLRALTRRMPGLELAADRVEYRDNLTLRGLQALPLAF